jgi:hypothetical protein
VLTQPLAPFLVLLATSSLVVKSLVVAWKDDEGPVSNRHGRGMSMLHARKPRPPQDQHECGLQNMSRHVAERGRYTNLLLLVETAAELPAQVERARGREVSICLGFGWFLLANQPHNGRRPAIRDSGCKTQGIT